MAKCVENRTNDRRSLVVTLAQLEPERRRRILHPGISRDKITARHPRQNRIGPGHILEPIHLDLQVPALDHRLRVRINRVQLVMIRNLLRLGTGHHQMVRLAVKHLIVVHSRLELIRDHRRDRIGIGQCLFIVVVVADECRFRSEIVHEHLICTRHYRYGTVQRAHTVCICLNISDKGLRCHRSVLLVEENHMHGIRLYLRHRNLLIIYVTGNIQYTFHVHFHSDRRIIGRVFQRTSMTSAQGQQSQHHR